MKRLRNPMLAAAAAILAVVTVPAAHSAEGLNQVLRQMDAAAAKFQSAQADLEWDQEQKLPVPDSEIQKGTVSFMRKGPDTLMAVHIQQVNGSPVQKIIVYDGSQLKFYEPNLKQMTVFNAGANRSQYESFLTLGFGGSGADLEKNWDVSYQGTEMVDGVKTAKLDLVPKQQSVKNNFSHVTIWVDPDRGISRKQVFFDPSGNTRTVTYSKIAYNTPVSRDAFVVKAAPGTTISNR